MGSFSFAGADQYGFYSAYLLIFQYRVCTFIHTGAVCAYPLCLCFVAGKSAAGRFKCNVPYCRLSIFFVWRNRCGDKKDVAARLFICRNRSVLLVCRKRRRAVLFFLPKFFRPFSRRVRRMDIFDYTAFILMVFAGTEPA